MKPFSRAMAAWRLAICCFAASLSQVHGGTPVAPPTPPPIQYQQSKATRSALSAPAALSQTLYSIGDPTDIEQLYVELINRARSNPAAEAQRLKNTSDPDILASYSYFGVDLNLMVSQFATLSAAPPVSVNAKLLAAARVHSQDMLANAYQAHVGTDGSQPWDRATAQGYSWTTFGENIYAYSSSAPFGHAGFEVDWGSGTGGMQSPAGHRINIHAAGFREIGVGVSLGTNGAVGPQIVTQDFAAQSSPSPYITGVAYYDFNGNGFYDIGEGIGGVTVTVAGSNYYAVTANSGGYSVPVPGNGTYTVTFSAPGATSQASTVSVSNSSNVKVDYVPVYTTPYITGPGTLLPAQSGTFSYSAVGAATGYQWKQESLTNYTLVEGAENGMNNVTAIVSSGYSVIETDTVKNGTSAFHLAHPQPLNQALQLNHTLRITANSALTFWSRLGWASPDQLASAQVSTDGGNQWQDVWTIAGTNSAGQTSFSQQSVPLIAFAGQDVIIRFLYRFTSGSYYSQTSAGSGFYIDDIAVTNAQELLGTTIASASNGSFPFSSLTTGTFSLSVRALLPGRTLPWGLPKTVTVQSTPPTTGSLQTVLSPAEAVAAGAQWQVDGGQWMNSGATATGLSAGSHTIAFKAVNGWTAPGTQNVTVSLNQTASASGTYLRQYATLTLQAAPNASGTVNGGGSFPVGSAQQISATPNTGWLFSAWNDGSTQSTRTVTVPSGGATYIANFRLAPVPAQMLSPTNGNTLSSSAVTFTWDTGTGVSQYALWVGSAVDTYDLYAGNEGTNQYKTIALPADGRHLYVRLWSMIDGAWQYNSYTYTAYTGPAPVKAQMTAPANGSTLPSPAATFSWNPGVSVSQYALWIGSTPNSYDLYAGVEGTNLTKNITLPADGRPIYVRLWSMINGAWEQYNSYVFTAYTGPDPKARMTNPASGSTLTPTSTTFNWDAGTGVTQYALWVGSTVNSYDLYAGNEGKNLSKILTLPTDGRPIYVRLWSMVGGVWKYNSYIYTAYLPASGLLKAQMTSPVNGSALTSGSATFSWNAGQGATQYALWIGSAPDTYDLYAGLEGSKLTKTLALPTDGRAIYVRLWSMIGGVWQQYNSYVYTAMDGKAQMLTPANGNTFASSSVTFTWNAGTGATQYALWVGSAPGEYDLYAGNEGTNLSKKLTLPTDGRPIYVQLWSMINGAWIFNKYIYTAQ